MDNFEHQGLCEKFIGVADRLLKEGKIDQEQYNNLTSKKKEYLKIYGNNQNK